MSIKDKSLTTKVSPKENLEEVENLTTVTNPNEVSRNHKVRKINFKDTHEIEILEEPEEYLRRRMSSKRRDSDATLRSSPILK